MKLTPSLGGAYSGSFGGITASRNRGGQYFRRRAMPTNPNTAPQQNVRDGFGQAMSRWSQVLTETQRANWRTYAENVSWTDSLGQSIKLTGAQMYCRTNAVILSSGAYVTTPLVPADEAPTDYTLGPVLPDLQVAMEYDPVNPILVPPAPALTMTFSWTGNLASDHIAFVYLGRPRNASQQFYKGPYQLIGGYEGEEDADLAVMVVEAVAGDPPYSARYGVPQTGATLSGYIRVLAPDGRLGQKCEFTGTVEAAAGP